MSDTVMVAIISGSLGVCSTIGAAVLSKRAQSASSGNAILLQENVVLLQGYKDLVKRLQERITDLEHQLDINEIRIAKLETRLYKNGF